MNQVSCNKTQKILRGRVGVTCVEELVGIQLLFTFTILQHCRVTKLIPPSPFRKLNCHLKYFSIETTQVYNQSELRWEVNRLLSSVMASITVILVSYKSSLLVITQYTNAFLQCLGRMSMFSSLAFERTTVWRIEFHSLTPKENKGRPDSLKTYKMQRRKSELLTNGI